jgi:hypothetical protein
MAKKAKKKRNWPLILTTILYLSVGIGGGLAMVEYMERVGAFDFEPTKKYLFFVVFAVLVYASIYVDIILHEAGHLIFGLASGYRFVSFRIGSLTLLRGKEGKLRFALMKMAGTGGQCLMSPPDMVDGKIPVVLYNLGGCIVNAVAGAVMLMLYFLFCPKGTLISVCLMIAALFNFAVCLTNGIPMNTAMIANDGKNALQLGHDPVALRAFWLQLKINEQQTLGVSLRDMPADWFEMPADEDMKNSLVAAIGVIACSRLIDEGRYEEADTAMACLLDAPCGLLGIHRHMLVCERMFFEIIGENRPAVLDDMRTPEQLKFMKLMRTNPTVIRVEYAYAKLTDFDERRAEELKKLFEKCAAKYPFATEIETERRLWTLVEARGDRGQESDEKGEES